MDDAEQQLEPSKASSQTELITEPDPDQPEYAIHPKTPGWGLLLWWAVANTVGAVIGAFITDAITHGVFNVDYSNDMNSLQKGVASGVLLGGMIGFVEWFVLRKYMPRIVLWIPATSLGWAIGLLANAYLIGHESSDRAEVFVIGICIGIPQCLVLWRRVRWAGIWIGVTILAWGVLVATLVPMSDSISALMNAIIGRRYDFEGPLWESDVRRALEALWIFGVLEGITGVGLLFLLRQPADIIARRLKPRAT